MLALVAVVCAATSAATARVTEAEPVPEPVVLAQAEVPPGSPEETERDAASQGPDDPEITDAELDAAARSSAEPPPGVEVMRIRGRGIGALETEVPESVTRFDAATIQALAAQNVSDLARVTPNVEIVTGSATQANFFIRGVGLADFSSNAASAVAIFQDGVALNTPPLQLGQIFDVESVEVLRGPQAVGPDRNASAGAIRVQSRRPTGDYMASMRTILGRYDAESEGAHDGFIQDYEGALEFPLVEELLFSRFAFRFRDAEPFRSNGCGGARSLEARREDALDGDGEFGPGAGPNRRSVNSICNEALASVEPAAPGSREFISTIPAGLPTEVGDEHDWAARGQLRLQPPDSGMDWLLNVHGSRLDQDSTLGQAIGSGQLPGAGPSFGGPAGQGQVAGYFEPDLEEEWLARCPDQSGCQAEAEAFGEELASGRPLDERPYRGDYNQIGQTVLETWGGFLRGDVAIGDTTLTSLSAYDSYTRSQAADTDFTPNRLFEVDADDEVWQLWQQLSLAGELDRAPLRWDVGAYYLREELEVESDTNLAALFNSPKREYTQDIWSWGAWGGFSWDFLDDFTLEGGVRYNWEKKDFAITRSLPNSPNAPVESDDDSETWQAPTGEISLTYRFREGLSAYAKYSRGFKAGHFNATPPTTIGTEVLKPPADSESIDSFEAGFGGSWLDGRLSASATAFYYLYENYQIFLFTDTPGASSSGPILEVLNAESAENYGAELDARIEPLAGWAPRWADGLVINTRFGWLESEFLDFQNIVDRRAEFVSQPFPVTLDYTGNRLPNSPKYAVSGSAEWTFDLGRWGSIIPRYDFAWTDDVTFDASNGQGSVDRNGNPSLPELAIGQPAFWLHNLRLGYRMPTGNVEVGIWCRNCTDEVYKTYAFDVSQFQKVVINFTGKPRTIGMDLSVTF